LTFQIRNETGVWSDHKNTTIVNCLIDGPQLILESVPDAAGFTQLMIKAIDHDGEWTWTLLDVKIVDINDGPRVRVPFGRMAILEDHSFLVQVSYHVYDPDDDFSELTMTVTGSPDLVATVSNPYLTIYPVADWFGEAWLDLGLEDPDGASLTLHMEFDVLPVNDPPVLSFPSIITIMEDETFEINLSEAWIDVDSKSVEWNVTPLTGKVDAVLVDDNLRLIPRPDWYGASMIEVIADDGIDNTSMISTMYVTGVNDPPRYEHADPLVMEEDTVMYFDLSSLNPYDPEGSPVSWSVIDVPDMFRSVSVLSNNTMRIAPNSDDHGRSNITAKLSDLEGGSTEVLFDVIVLSVNDSPFFSIREDALFLIEEGSTFEIDLQGQVFIIFDIETQNENLTVIVDNPNVVVEGLRLMVTVPVGIASDSFHISISVEDAEGARSEEVNIPIKVRRVDPYRDLTLNITGVEYFSHDDVLTIIAYGSPYQIIWVVFTDGSSMKMVETPPGNGKYLLEIDVSDWENDTRIKFHLSDKKGGSDQSKWGILDYTYVKVDAEQTRERLDLGLILLFAGLLASLIAVLLLFVIVGRRKVQIEE
jgi:hypothetical protein